VTEATTLERPPSGQVVHRTGTAEKLPTERRSPLPQRNSVWGGGAHRHDGPVKVEAINIGREGVLGPVDSVSAHAGKGLEGDRHFFEHGAGPGNALTLVEAEVLEDVGLTGAQSRRQVVVRGVRLNDLVGRRFRVGNVECLGVEICEPCLHLQKLTRAGIIKDMIHRGGLNADILVGGKISVGDLVTTIG
jgi:MOSC domain-containing protein YiiM